MDFWERMVYDNVVNQSTHTNKYKNTTKSITQSIAELDKTIKQAINSNKNAVLTHRLFKVGGAKHNNTAQSILH